MKKNILNLYIFTILCMPFSLQAQEKEEAIKILFVGNSFTYFWNMPSMLGAMAENQDVPLEIHQSTVGGSNLEEHYNQKRGTQTKALLEKEKWNYVILQDHSLSTIEAAGRFREYGSKLIELVRSNEAEPLLFMTWSYRSNPLMQSVISRVYKKLGDSLNIEVIPVGDIFMKARSLRPDLCLYYDNKHPSSNASYLIALIFYRALTGKPVSDIPERLLSRDKNGQAFILSFVSKEDADFFKELVNQYKFQGNSIIER